MFFIALVTGLAFQSSGQLSYGGSPASFSFLKEKVAAVPVIDMVAVDNAQLLKEEQVKVNRLKPFKFAKSFKVDISPKSSGLWTVQGDMKIWRVVLRSKGAWSLNIIFDKMIIPQGASLFIYASDHSKVLGAFTSDNEQSSGYFPTYPIAGDEIVVEYNEPKAAAYPGELHISSVNHDYKNAFGSRLIGEAGLCNMDVYCPEAANFLILKQSVVRLEIGGQYLCTGTLVNNTKQDTIPYLLTAGHCITDSIDAQTTVFCFNYESPSCGAGRSSINGYSDQTMSGAFLKARSDSLDFALMQLETSPPAEFRPFYAGWDRSSAIPSSAATISHPNADVKKVSVDKSAPTIGTFSSEFVAKSFWVVGKWSIGTTEPGSSGCALLNENRMVVGSLTGGTSTCADPTNDLFSMFSKQWDHFKASNLQLKYWLDPSGTGASQLPALNPVDNTNACKLFTNATIGERDTLFKVSKQSGGYKTGHNYMGVTSYAEQFTKTKQTLLSSVSIGIAKMVSKSTSSKITLKVYDESTTSGLPDTELYSMDLPYSVLSAQCMNNIELANPVVVHDQYFIGFDLNYSTSTDTFAVYCAPDRGQQSKNYAFAFLSGGWKPFYGITQLGISTSLLINANGCQNSAATDTVPKTIITNKYVVIYQQTGLVIYQQTGENDNIMVQNTGTEQLSTISLYDILGRKVYQDHHLFLNTPAALLTGQLPTGVYFLTIETGQSRQIMKIRVINSR